MTKRRIFVGVRWAKKMTVMEMNPCKVMLAVGLGRVNEACWWMEAQPREGPSSNRRRATLTPAAIGRKPRGPWDATACFEESGGRGQLRVGSQNGPGVSVTQHISAFSRSPARDSTPIAACTPRCVSPWPVSTHQHIHPRCCPLGYRGKSHPVFLIRLMGRC